MTGGEPEARGGETAGAGGLDFQHLADRLEKLLLGSERTLRPAEVAAQAGVDRGNARQMWRSLGFPLVGDDDVFFTDYDVAALDVINRIRELGFEDDELRAAMARFVGQTYARLASWQGQLMLDMLAKRPELLASEDRVVELVEQLLPDLEQMQRYVWRRQLAAYLSRIAARLNSPEEAGDAQAAIGFADLAGFTSLTRRVGEEELRSILDAFESSATDVVGAHGGRIVKTIGDEVLYTAADAAAGAEIALGLLAARAEHEQIPPIRVGVAYGPVVDRLGDVYGATVNIAARLTSLAKPGWVLVDRGMSEALQDDASYQIRQRRSEHVRGYNHLRLWRLKRAV